MNISKTTEIEQYSKAKQVALGKYIAHRKKVYLDVRFWIIARDTMLEDFTDSNSRELLHYLRQGVANKTLICPISATTFFEVMKQPFNSKR